MKVYFTESIEERICSVCLTETTFVVNGSSTCCVFPFNSQAMGPYMSSFFENYINLFFRLCSAL